MTALQLPSPVSYGITHNVGSVYITRSFSSGNASDVVVDIEDFPPGEYNLTVRVRDESGQTGIAEVESLPLSGTITSVYQVLTTDEFMSHAQNQH